MSMLLNGVSGLNAANNALNVVGQNVANAAVKGYSRQTVYLETAGGSLNGVKVTKVDRIVNDFLNDDIWRTGSDVGFYDGFQSYLGYLEQILGTESLNLNDAVADISAAFNAAMSAPDSNAYRQQVLSSAQALVQDLSQINGALSDQQDKLGKELSNLADNSSSLFEQIAELNSKISKAQALGQPTSELSDAREVLVTELSAYMGVDIVDPGDGNINISSKNGAPLVVGSKAAAATVTGTTVEVNFNGQTFPLNESVGGRIGGLLNVDVNVLQPAKLELEQIVTNIADSVNTALSEGFDLNGLPGEPLFQYNPADVLGTISVNPALQPDDLAFIGNDGFGNPTGGRGDNGNIANLVASLNGGTAGYDTLIGDLAIQSKQVQSSVKTAQVLNNDAVAARDSVSGVNLDEEAANLMYYQQLYDANARVISTADQLFKTLINIF
ncbi:flagellar hook-associated protein FlgK [Rheinheimera sp.]|uniref:flagellar hook-associated protein FlgK n=1 Tax=Rheinheimera sp. TaxID=1869214 RepID=UPI0027375F0F|nr:flagellar hook-associated protein FlgK [Rheinheimera sp.]MDP2716691.1 flagellar hook-associated protein FlgK [Rheinheimera sp.]